MVVQVLCAYFGVMLFSLVVEVPRKQLLFSSAAGAVAWGAYVYIGQHGHSSMTAAFLSTLVLAVLSQLLARLRRTPVTVFLIPGILPAVPGAAIYRTVYYLIRNASHISVRYFIETLQIAGAMAIAIFIVDSVFRMTVRGKTMEKL